MERQLVGGVARGAAGAGGDGAGDSLPDGIAAVETAGGAWRERGEPERQSTGRGILLRFDDAAGGLGRADSRREAAFCNGDRLDGPRVVHKSARSGANGLGLVQRAV